MDFELSERQRHFRDRVRDFIESEIRPRAGDYADQAHGADRWRPVPVIEELKPRARAAGLWNLFMPPRSGRSHVDDSFTFEGEQLTNLEYALCAEEMGRVNWASEVFNCSAPDTGNMEVLLRYGTREQKDRWLAPLMQGEIRSAFLMTEPAVASSDATNIETRIEREGDEHRMLDPARWGRLCDQRPQMVVVGHGRSALQGRDRHGQVRSARVAPRQPEHDPDADGCAGRADRADADRLWL